MTVLAKDVGLLDQQSTLLFEVVNSNTEETLAFMNVDIRVSEMLTFEEPLQPIVFWLGSDKKMEHKLPAVSPLDRLGSITVLITSKFS